MNTPGRQPVSFSSSSVSSSSSSIPTTARRPPSTTTTTMAAGKTGEEQQHGSVFSVSGSVVVAENMIGCAMYELVSFFFLKLLFG